jgi:hypothetical protein
MFQTRACFAPKKQWDITMIFGRILQILSKYYSLHKAKTSYISKRREYNVFMNRCKMLSSHVAYMCCLLSQDFVVTDGDLLHTRIFYCVCVLKILRLFLICSTRVYRNT